MASLLPDEPTAQQQLQRALTGPEVDVLAHARQGLKDQARALERLAERLDERFDDALKLVLECEGRVVCTGMGKSGHVARKIAATLACAGTPSQFLHPAEAAHGDLGMVTPRDVAILISNSGETGELTWLIPRFREMGIPIIALVGNPESTLARGATVAFDISVDSETCPHNRVPTTSTLTSIAMGDALAVAAMQKRNVTAEDVARLHPGAPAELRQPSDIRDLCAKGGNGSGGNGSSRPTAIANHRTGSNGGNGSGRPAGSNGGNGSGKPAAFVDPSGGGNGSGGNGRRRAR